MRGSAALVALIAFGPLGGCRPREQASPGAIAPAEPPWLAEVTAEMDLDFRHDSGWDGSYFMPEHIGAGGALFDYDGDGDLDLYLVDSGPHGGEPGAPPGAPDRLFRHEADGRFSQQTERAGLGDRGYGMGAAVGDYDNDGDLDLFVTNYGPDALYSNQGDGSFSPVTAVAGLVADRWSTSACFFDYDRDDDLDLYVVTYVHHDPPKVCSDEVGRPEYCGPLAFRGAPDLLYRNEGDGTFTEVGDEAGIAALATRGLGVACLDLDDDGWQDVYVANDGEKNELWINRGDGTFEDQSLLLGAGLNLAGEAEASMGVAIGDVDGDLDPDLFSTHLDRETNTLYLNVGAGGFQDVTASWGLGPESLPYTGFGTGFFDLEQDGDLDLIVANGRVRRGKDWTEGRSEDALEVPDHWRHYAEPNLLFVNEGSGRFRDASARAGSLGSRVEVSRSVLYGDLDRDGDLDVVLTQCDGPTRVFRNDAPEKGRWSLMRVLGVELGRDLVGGRLIVEAAGRRQLGLVTSTYSYLAGVEPLVHFGLGDAERIDRLSWRSDQGARQSWLGLPADRRLHLYVKGRQG